MTLTKTPTSIATLGKRSSDDVDGTIPLILTPEAAVPDGWERTAISTRWYVYHGKRLVAQSRKRRPVFALPVSATTVTYKVVLQQYYGLYLGTRETVAMVVVKPPRAKRVVPASQAGLQLQAPKVAKKAAVKKARASKSKV